MAKTQWRITVAQSCALFRAFFENAKNPRIQERISKRQIAVWLETFKGHAGWTVLPAAQDEEFFPVLVEEELIRLSRSDAEESLPCGCEVRAHRSALQQFRLKNLSS